MWQQTFFDRPKSPPTREKHRWLAEAFGAWARSASPAATRTVFDGFAGAGRFGAPGGSSSDDDLGSPLLLVRWASDLPGRWRFVFAEKSRVNHARLREAVAAPAGLQSFVDVDVFRGTFETCARSVVAGVPKGEASLFSFVDPYGSDGVSFGTLRSLAERGDLLFHLATHQILTKLATASGASPRQARRMDALLGGVVPWTELRARGLPPRAALPHVPELLVRALVRDVPGLSARIIALRDGKSHLVHAYRAGSA